MPRRTHWAVMVMVGMIQVTLSVLWYATLGLWLGSLGGGRCGRYGR